MDAKAIGMGVGFALVWASAFTATRVVVQDFPPLTALVIRFAISGVIGILLGFGMGQRIAFSAREWRVLLLFGLCQNALYLGLAWLAMQWIEASTAAIIASTMPLLVALAGRVAFGERLRPAAVLGLVLGFAGVALVMGARMQHGLNLPGVALCALGTVALAVATLAVRGTGAGPNVMVAVGLQMLVGGAALLLPALVMERGIPFRWTPLGTFALGYSLLVSGILATWIWLRLVERVGATRAATFHFLSPIFGVAIAAALLGERFGPLDAVGAAVVAAGILLVQTARRPAAPQPARSAASSAGVAQPSGFIPRER